MVDKIFNRKDVFPAIQSISAGEFVVHTPAVRKRDLVAQHPAVLLDAIVAIDLWRYHLPVFLISGLGRSFNTVWYLSSSSSGSE